MPTANDSTILQVLRLLGARQQVSQRQVARALGMSLGRVNYCLRALMARGLVKAENYRKSDNKLAYFYLLTPAGFAAKADLTQRFLALKLQEHDALRQEIERLKQEVDATKRGSARSGKRSATSAKPVADGPRRDLSPFD